MHSRRIQLNQHTFESHIYHDPLPQPFLRNPSTSRIRSAIFYTKGCNPMTNHFNYLLASNDFSANNMRRNPSLTSTGSVRKTTRLVSSRISTSRMKFFKNDGSSSLQKFVVPKKLNSPKKLIYTPSKTPTKVVSSQHRLKPNSAMNKHIDVY